MKKLKPCGSNFPPLFYSLSILYFINGFSKKTGIQKTIKQTTSFPIINCSAAEVQHIASYHSLTWDETYSALLKASINFRDSINALKCLCAVSRPASPIRLAFSGFANIYSIASSTALKSPGAKTKAFSLSFK